MQCDKVSCNIRAMAMSQVKVGREKHFLVDAKGKIHFLTSSGQKRVCYLQSTIRQISQMGRRSCYFNLAEVATGACRSAAL